MRENFELNVDGSIWRTKGGEIGLLDLSEFDFETGGDVACCDEGVEGYTAFGFGSAEDVDVENTALVEGRDAGYERERVEFFFF
jgi:hypothetical protein